MQKCSRLRSVFIKQCALFAALAVAIPTPLNANPEPVHSDRLLMDGFYKTVFGSENWRVSRAARERVSKFTGPVRVHISDLASTNRSGEVRRFINVINRRVRGLSISVTSQPKSANFFVFLVDRQNYRSAIREVLPDVQTGFLERSACSGIAFLRNNSAIEQSMAFVVANEGATFFRHCMIEEILQGLGPSNDHRSLQYSIFNDRNSISSFTRFDTYILNMLYDQRVRPGMDRRAVRDVLPRVLQDTRKRV